MPKHRIISTLLILSLIATSSFAKSGNPFIVRDGSIVAPTGNSFKGVTIKTKKPEVYSLSEGEILSTVRINSSYTIIVKSLDRVYVYANLDQTLFAKGQHVSAGDRIGLLTKNEDNNFLLQFEVWLISSKGKTTERLTYQQIKNVAGFQDEIN